MITEEMVERALSGAKVYYVDSAGACRLLWLVGDKLRNDPALEDQCAQ